MPGLTRHPAALNTVTYGNQRRWIPRQARNDGYHAACWKSCPSHFQVVPIRVFLLNERDFHARRHFFSFFSALLLRASSGDTRTRPTCARRTFCEAVDYPGFVLGYPLRQVRRDADVKRPVPFAREDVDGGLHLTAPPLRRLHRRGFLEAVFLDGVLAHLVLEDFARGVHREGLDEVHVLRAFMARHVREEVVLYLLLGRGLAVLQDYAGAYLLAERLVGHADDLNVLDLRVRVEELSSSCG